MTKRKLELTEPPMKKLKQDALSTEKTWTKEELQEILTKIDYPNIKTSLLNSYTTAKEAIQAALKQIDESDTDINIIDNVLLPIKSKINDLNTAFASYKTCLNKVPCEKAKKLLEKSIAILPEIEALPEYEQILRSVYSLKREYADVNEFNSQLKTALQNLSTLDIYKDTDVSLLQKKLSLLNSTIDNKLQSIKTHCENIRSPNINLLFEKKILDVNIIYEYMNRDTKKFNTNQSQNLFTQLNLIDNLTRVKNTLHTDHPFKLSIERNLESARQNWLAQVSPKKPSTSTPLKSHSMFANKFTTIEQRQPITTWNINKETDIQTIFLQNLFKNGIIRNGLSRLKKDINFNISFLEYIDNGNYKILFAISGSNDALKDSRHTQKANGINGAIIEFVKNWNKQCPNVQFEYVSSYKGKHLNMDDGSWYCSEPKLAIEFSKIKRRNSDVSIVGQNNWSISPHNFSFEENDACKRHCQNKQKELVSFNGADSPMRVN